MSVRSKRLIQVCLPLILVACSTPHEPVAAPKPVEPAKVVEAPKAREEHTTPPAPRAAAAAKPAPAPAPAGKSVEELTKTWSESALQRKDDARRASALDQIRAALESRDPIASQAALLAVAAIGDLAYDKAGMHELVLPYLDATDAATLRAAWNALNKTVTQPGDLEHLMALESKAPKQFRDESYTHLLFVFANGDLSGPAGALVERLLADVDPGSRRQLIGSLSGAHVTPGLEQRLLEFSLGSDYNLANDALYLGLSTFNPKSAAVVMRLIEVLGASDRGLSSRALWGLESGVQPSESVLVADAALRLFETRERGDLERLAKLLALHGTSAHAEKLEKLAVREGANDDVKAQAKSAAEQIRRRTG